MSSTVQETLLQLQEQQHELAVYATLVAFLDGEFLPHAGTNARRTIQADGCAESTVPGEAIESVRDLLMENHVGPLEKRIADLLTKKVT
jgi:hypothetical protein